MSDQSSSNTTDSNQTTAALSPELVREVAEKVYALWLRDIQIERERLGAHSVANRNKRQNQSRWR